MQIPPNDSDWSMNAGESPQQPRVEDRGQRQRTTTAGQIQRWGIKRSDKGPTTASSERNDSDQNNEANREDEAYDTDDEVNNTDDEVNDMDDEANDTDDKANDTDDEANDTDDEANDTGDKVKKREDEANAKERVSNQEERANVVGMGGRMMGTRGRGRGQGTWKPHGTIDTATSESPVLKTNQQDHEPIGDVASPWTRQRVYR